MNRRFSSKLYSLIGGLLLFVNNTLLADDIYMVRSPQPFPETMSALQKAIKQAGYTLTRVQRVDIGLTQMGYKTDKYRIVFFGKLAETRMLVKNYPELIPYLPLKIAIFSENDETLLTASNRERFSEMYPNKELAEIFTRWGKDVRKILDDVRQADNND